MEGLTRGQLAQRAQINLETVRFYEQEGLLAPPSRTASGYRKFEEAAVDRLAFVKRAKALGFSLGEIRELLVIQDGHADACVEVRDLLQNKWQSSAPKWRSSKSWTLISVLLFANAISH